jgi:hypothetical protein
MTDLDNAREAWGAIHRRMLTNASLATSKALEGLILQSADETGDLISALEDRLARAEGVTAKVEAYLDGPMPEGMSYMTSFTRRAFIDGVAASRSVVRAILSKANKEAS